jgi:hypothetical protein
MCVMCWNTFGDVFNISLKQGSSRKQWGLSIRSYVLHFVKSKKPLVTHQFRNSGLIRNNYSAEFNIWIFRVLRSKVKGFFLKSSFKGLPSSLYIQVGLSSVEKFYAPFTAFEWEYWVRKFQRFLSRCEINWSFDMIERR